MSSIPYMPQDCYNYKILFQQFDESAYLHQSFKIGIKARRGFGDYYLLSKIDGWRISVFDESDIGSLTKTILKQQHTAHIIEISSEEPNIEKSGFLDRNLFLQGKAIFLEPEQPSNIYKVFIYDSDNKVFCPAIYQEGILSANPSSLKPENYYELCMINEAAFWRDEHIFVPLEMGKAVSADRYHRIDSSRILVVYNTDRENIFSNLEQRSRTEDVREDFRQALMNFRKKLHLKIIEEISKIDADLICIASGLNGNSMQGAMKIDIYNRIN